MKTWIFILVTLGFSIAGALLFAFLEWLFRADIVFVGCLIAMPFVGIWCAITDNRRKI